MSLPSPIGNPPIAFRDGMILVVPNGSGLPRKCVKCGAASDKPLTKTFRWHPPAVYLFLILLIPGVILYWIMSLMLGKKARVEVPFCELHRSWRKQRIVAGLLLTFGFVPVLMLLGTLGFKSGVGAVIMVAMITAGAILLLKVSSSFGPVYIDESCAKFKGACEQFLSALPKGSHS